MLLVTGRSAGCSIASASVPGEAVLLIERHAQLISAFRIVAHGFDELRDVHQPALPQGTVSELINLTRRRSARKSDDNSRRMQARGEPSEITDLRFGTTRSRRAIRYHVIRAVFTLVCRRENGASGQGFQRT